MSFVISRILHRSRLCCRRQTGRQVHKDSTGDPSSLKTILNVLSEVDGLTGCQFAWTEPCLFWDDLLVYGAILFSISRSNSLYVWHRSETGRKLLESDGSFPGFRSASMRALSQMLGSFCVAIQVLNRLRSHIFVCSPKCLICSVEMLSRPTAFPGFRLCIAVSSSIIVNSLVKPGSVGYF